MARFIRPGVADWLQLLDAACTHRDELLAQLFMLCSSVKRGTQSLDRDSLLDLVADIRREGVVIVESVKKWREAVIAADPFAAKRFDDEGTGSVAKLANFNERPFMFRGKDYLVRMLHDTDFIADVPDVCNLLRLPSESCFLNPLFAPTNLLTTLKYPSVPLVCEFLISIATADEHRRLISRALVRDFVDDRSYSISNLYDGGSGRSSPVASGRLSPNLSSSSSVASLGGDFAAVLANSAQMAAPPVTPLSKLISNPSNSSMHISLAMSNKNVITAAAFRAGAARSDDIVETDLHALLEQVSVRALVERVRMVRSQISLSEEANRAGSRLQEDTELGAVSSTSVTAEMKKAKAVATKSSSSPSSSPTVKEQAIASPTDSVSSLALSSANNNSSPRQHGALPTLQEVVTEPAEPPSDSVSSSTTKKKEVAPQARIQYNGPSSAMMNMPSGTLSADASFFSLDSNFDKSVLGVPSSTPQTTNLSQPPPPSYAAAAAGHSRNEAVPNAAEAARLDKEAKERKERDEYTLSLARKLQEHIRSAAVESNSAERSASPVRSLSPAQAEDALTLANRIVANLGGPPVIEEPVPMNVMIAGKAKEAGTFRTEAPFSFLNPASNDPQAIQILLAQQSKRLQALISSQSDMGPSGIGIGNVDYGPLSPQHLQMLTRSTQSALLRQQLAEEEAEASRSLPMGGLPILSAMPVGSSFGGQGMLRQSGLKTSVYSPLPAGNNPRLTASIASSLQYQGDEGYSNGYGLGPAEVPEERLEGSPPSRQGSRPNSRGVSPDRVSMSRDLWGKTYIQPVKGGMRPGTSSAGASRPIANSGSQVIGGSSQVSNVRNIKRAMLEVKVGDLEKKLAAQNLQLQQLQELQHHLNSRAKRAASGKSVKGSVISDEQMSILRRMSERGPSSAQTSVVHSNNGAALGSLTPQQMKQMQRIQEALRGGSAGPASVLSGDSDYSPNSSAFPSRGGFGFTLGPTPPGVKEHKVKVEPMFPRMAAMEKMKRRNTASSNRSPAPSASNHRKASPSGSVRSRLPSPSPSVRSSVTATRGRKPSTALPGKRQTQEKAARDGSQPLQNLKRVKSASAIKSVSRSPAPSRPPPSPARSSSRGPSPQSGIVSTARPISSKRDRAVSHVAPSPSPVRPSTSGNRGSALSSSPAPRLKAPLQASSPASSMVASPQASITASPRPPRPESVKKSSMKSVSDSDRKRSKAMPEKKTTPMKKNLPEKKDTSSKKLPAVQPLPVKKTEAKQPVAVNVKSKTQLPTISEPAPSTNSVLPSKPTALPHPSRSLPKTSSHIAPVDSSAAQRDTSEHPIVTPLSPLTVKVSVSGSVYRLHLERATIANLSSTLAKAVPTAIKSFTFIDDEGDVVTLHDDHNLLEALSASKSSGKIARFDALTDSLLSSSSSSSRQSTSGNNAPTASAVVTGNATPVPSSVSQPSSASISAPSMSSKSVAFDMTATSDPPPPAVIKSNVPGLDPSVMVPSVFPQSSADSLTPSRKVPYRAVRSPSPRADLERIQMAMGGSIGGGVRSASPALGVSSAYTDAPRSRTPIEPAYASYEAISSSAKAGYSPLRSHFEVSR
jgi:hypothetical protein